MCVMSHSLQALESEVKLLVAQSCPTLCNPMDCSLPGKNTGVERKKKRILEWVSIPFSGGIFPNQGSNPGFLLHCRQILYHLSHQGSPTSFRTGI